MGLFTYLLYFVIYGMGSFFVSTVPHMIQDELPPHECDAIWSYQVVKNTCDYMRDSSLVRHLSASTDILTRTSRRRKNCWCDSVHF